MGKQVRPLLQAMGRGVIELGADPAAAASAKLIGNFLIVSQARPQRTSPDAAPRVMLEGWLSLFSCWHVSNV